MMLARKKAITPGIDHEAIRSLASRLVADGGPGAAVALASGNPGEGTTTVLVSLARALEQGPGRRVLVVDWNIEAPRLHTVYGLPRIPGATDVLTGSIGLREAVYISASGTLAVLPAGRTYKHPAALFGPDGFSALLAPLRGMGFDLTLIDLPALLSWPEAVEVAAFCTQTLIVVRAGHTERKDGVRVRDRLIGAGAAIAGVVLTDVH